MKWLKILTAIFFGGYFTSILVVGELYPWNYLTYIFIVLLTITCLFSYLLEHKFYFDLRTIPYFLFVAYAVLISLIMKSTSIRNVLTFLMLAFSLLVCFYAFKLINNKKAIFYITLSSAIIYAIVFFALYYKEFISFKFLDVRLGGKLGNENTAGIIAIIFTSFASIVSIKEKKYWLLLLNLPFILIGVSTGSKKTYFAFVLLFLFVLYLLLRKHPFVYLFSVIGVFILSILALQLPFMSSVKERIYEMIGFIFTGVIDVSSYERLTFSQNAFYLFSKNVFFGLGEHGFQANTMYGTYSHNNFLEMACNFGLIGFVLFYLQMLLPIFAFKRNYDNSLYLFSFFIFVFYLIFGIGLIFYSSKLIPIFLSIILFSDGDRLLLLKMETEI